jgi:putative peptidoglycan lipid II flippase
MQESNKESNNQILKATGIIMIAMMLSRILGYARDVIIYSKFGQNYYTDAYNAAFSVPDLIYYLLVGGALSSAFIPVISGYIAKNEKDEAWHVVSTVFNLIMILLSFGIAIGMIFTEELIYILVPGFNQESIDLTVKLTRIMFAQSFLMTLNGIIQGVLHSSKHFLSPAIGSVLYNVGIIAIGLLLSKPFGIAGFSIGVVGGALLNFLILLPALKKTGIKYYPGINLKHPGVIKLFRLIIPVFIGLSVTHLNLFVTQNLASQLPEEGMISALRAAYRISMLPIGIFGLAIGVSFFPSLTGHAARNEKKEYVKLLSLGIRTIVYITLPSTIGIIALKTPIVRTMFQQGNFTVANTEATAHALFFYSLGIVAYSAQALLYRSFYATEDTRTPVVVGVTTMSLNIILSIMLVKYMNHGGLALAHSVAGIFNMVILLGVIKMKFGQIDGKNMLVSFTKTSISSIIMGLSVYFTAQIFGNIFGTEDKILQILQVLIATGAGIVVYFISTSIMKMEEAKIVKNIVMKKLKRG